MRLSTSIPTAAPLVVPNDISWAFTQDSQRTLSGSHYEYSENRWNLTILNVNYNDEGVYQMTARNKNGQDSATIDLIVHGM